MRRRTFFKHSLFGMLLVVNLFAHLSNAQICTFCESGITNPSLDLPSTQGFVESQTCADVPILILDELENSELCIYAKEAETVCCPRQEPCTFCDEGDMPDPDLEVKGRTCAEVKVFASELTKDDNLCVEIKLEESSCCPGAASSSAPSPASGLPTTSSSVASLSPTLKSTTTSPAFNQVSSSPTAQNKPSLSNGTGSITGVAFYDSNNNGNHESMLEYGVWDIKASLFSCGDDASPRATTSTDTKGAYKFENLAEGQYYVKFEYPRYYLLGNIWNGDASTLTVNNSADPGTGITNCFSVDDGEQVEADVALIFNPNPTTSTTTPPPTLPFTTQPPNELPTAVTTQSPAASVTTPPSPTSQSGSNTTICTFCERGIPDLMLEVPGTGQNCSTLQFTAADYFNGSAICTIIQEEETVCCPETIRNNSCIFCEDGIIDENFVPPNAGGNTCGQVKALAGTESADSTICSILQKQESSCCLPPLGKPCIFCEDGMPDPDYEILGYGHTCASLKSVAAEEVSESGTCMGVQAFEEKCCPESTNATTTPAPANVPTTSPTSQSEFTPSSYKNCTFCEGGMIDVGLKIPGGEGQTCGLAQQMADAENGTSPLCGEIQQAQKYCCPKPIADHCTFCRDGIDNIDLELPESGGRTCGTLNALAATFEQNSTLCTTLQNAERKCCPPLACIFCQEGIPNPQLVIEEAGGKSCASLEEVSFTVQGDSDLCSRMKAVESQCCPESLEGADNETLPTSPPSSSPLTNGTLSPSPPLPLVEAAATNGIEMVMTGVDAIQNMEAWENVTAAFIMDYFKKNSGVVDVENVQIFLATEDAMRKEEFRRESIFHRQLQQYNALRITYNQITSFRTKYPESYVYDADYIAEEPFKKDSAGYIAMLKNRSSYYDPVVEVQVTVPSSRPQPPTPPVPAPVMSPEKNDDTSNATKYIIIGVVCGAVLIAFIAGVLIVRSRRKRQFVSVPQIISVRSVESEESSVKDLERGGIASASSAFENTGAVATAATLKFSSGEVLEVIAPAGKLGMMVDDSPQGGSVCVVDLHEDSPLLGLVHLGDKIVAVDDNDVQKLTAFDLSKLLARKSRNPQRKITILRAGGKGEAQSSFSHQASNSLVAASSSKDTSSENAVTIIAPMGKLGVVIENSPGGPTYVSGINENSVLKGKIQLNDKIVSVDDEDVSELKAFHITQILASKSRNSERKIVVMRTTTGAS